MKLTMSNRPAEANEAIMIDGITESYVEEAAS